MFEMETNASEQSSMETTVKNSESNVSKPLTKITCTVCDITFANFSNLSRHRKNLHKESTEKSTDSSSKQLVYCAECGVSFSNACNLPIHHEKYHKNSSSVETKTKVFCTDCGCPCANSNNLLRHIKHFHKEKVLENKSIVKSFFCDECGASFSHLANLAKHKMYAHGRDALKRFKCAVCYEALTSRKLLFEHLTEKHEIEFKSETKEFESEEEFLRWKEEVEKRDLSSFVTANGSVKRLNGTSVSHYSCHRSGKYKPRGTNKRRLKRTGTNKIGYRCPAEMKVSREPNRIVVVYQSTHVGHTIDVERLRLPSIEKAMLSSDVIVEEAIENIQATLDTDHKLVTTTDVTSDGRDRETIPYCEVVVDDVTYKCDILCSDCGLSIDNANHHDVCKHVQLIDGSAHVVQFDVIDDGGGDDDKIESVEQAVESYAISNVQSLTGTEEEIKEELIKMAQVVVEEIQKSSSTSEFQAILDGLGLIQSGLTAVRNSDAEVASSD